MTESAVPQPSLRCSDADRERTATRLREASSAGYLTMDEVDERLATAYAARYGHELDVLVRDLPRSGFRPEAVWAFLLERRLDRSNVRLRKVVAVLAVLGVIGSALAGFEVFDFDGFGDDD